MPANINKAQSAKFGFQFDNGAALLADSGVPWTVLVGQTIPRGTVYIDTSTNGVYIHITTAGGGTASNWPQVVDSDGRVSLDLIELDDVDDTGLVTDDLLIYDGANFVRVPKNTFVVTAGGSVITGSLDISGHLDVDNLRFDGNAISSQNTNGAINLTPNGTGEAQVAGQRILTESDLANLNDADTLDGLDSSQFLRSDANDTASGIITLTNASTYPLVIDGAAGGKILLAGADNPYIRFREGVNDRGYIQWVASNDGLALINQQGAYLDVYSLAHAYVGIRLRGSDSVVRGYFYANTSNDVGILDAGGNWAIRHLNDQGTQFFSDNGAEQFAIGVDLVTGGYGTVETKGSGKGGYEGYSINGRSVFMDDGSTHVGLYDDVNNKWFLLAYHGAAVELYHAGVKKFETTSLGVDITGALIVDREAADVAHFYGLGDTYIALYDGTTRAGYIQTHSTAGLIIASERHGQPITLTAETAGGTNRTMLAADPDNSVGLYYAGTKKFETTATGALISGSLQIPHVVSGDAPLVVLKNYETYGMFWRDAPAGDDIVFKFGNIDKHTFNEDGTASFNGSRVLTTADEGTGNGLDADTVDGLHASSFLRSDAADTTTGVLTLRPSVAEILRFSATIANQYLSFYDTDNTTRRAYLSDGATMVLRSEVHGRIIQVQGEDTGGANQVIFSGDPDAGVNLYHAGTKKFETTSAGATVTGNLTAVDIEATGEIITNFGGTQTDPQLRFDGDTDTGIYSNVANTMSFTTAGVRTLFLDGAGDEVLIGRDLRVGTGQIELSGAGRIQGIDTVTDGTDAANKTYVDAQVAANTDADTLDGLDSTAFLNNTAVSVTPAADLAVGWYTIAINGGSRASARFGVRDIASNRHSAVTFYAGHNYGTGNTINVLHHSRFSTDPIRYIRIKDSGTYDGAALQVYVEDSQNAMLAFLLGDNFQTGGWAMVSWIPDATDPGVSGTWASFTESVKVDRTQYDIGGQSSTGYVYSKGVNTGSSTTQYRCLTTDDEGTGNGLDADTVDGLDSTQFLRSDAADTTTGVLTLRPSVAEILRFSATIANQYLSFYDTDNTTRRAYLSDGATMVLRSEVHGRIIQVQGEDTGGANQVIFSGDPDAGVNLYHAGTKKFETTSAGAQTNGDHIITGDLTVQGTTFTVDSNTVNIGDNIIVLNADEAGAPSQDGGIEIERGTSANVQLLWNETTDQWEADGNKLLTTADEGAGNGLDADTLDGLHGASYVRGDAVDQGLVDINVGNNDFIVRAVTGGEVNVIWYDDSAATVYLGGSSTTVTLRGNLDTQAGHTISVNGSLVLTQADEGTGNGLDADTVDGLDSTQFLRSDVADTITARLTIDTTDGEAFRVDGGTNPYISLYELGTRYAYIQSNNSSGFVIQSERHGAAFNFIAEDAGGTDRTVFYADPDNATHLYYNGTSRLETTGTGAAVTGTLLADGGTFNGNVEIDPNKAIYWRRDANSGYIPHPGGGQLNLAANNNTGAIKIEFPVYATADMLSFWVDIYDYNGNQSMSFYIAGYLYQATGGNEWHHITATCLTNQNYDSSRTVRFGTENSKHCIWIGETTSDWDYPVVSVRDVQVGYTSVVESYLDDWNITLETAFGTVEETVTTTLPLAVAKGGDADTLDGLDSTSFLRSDAADTAAGAITFNAGLTMGASQKITNNTTITRDKIRVWSDANYTIGMGSAYTYGWLNDYAMTFQMSTHATRGWWWGDSADTDAQGAMSLTTNGELCVNDKIAVGGQTTRYLTDVTGEYGSIQINGSGLTAWEGYSVDGRAVFMHNGTTTTGLWNDVDNQWIIRAVHDSGAFLYYAGATKFETSVAGVTVTGDILVTGGDITLQGTGRIQGIDTVSAATDAANKSYVDAQVSGAGGGATGGGTDEVFWENDQNCTTNYTLTTGKNAMTAGPITIDNGVTITVPTGSTWTVV